MYHLLLLMMLSILGGCNAGGQVSTGSDVYDDEFDSPLDEAGGQVGSGGDFDIEIEGDALLADMPLSFAKVRLSISGNEYQTQADENGHFVIKVTQDYSDETIATFYVSGQQPTTRAKAAIAIELAAIDGLKRASKSGIKINAISAAKFAQWSKLPESANAQLIEEVEAQLQLIPEREIYQNAALIELAASQSIDYVAEIPASTLELVQNDLTYDLVLESLKASDPDLLAQSIHQQVSVGSCAQDGSLDDYAGCNLSVDDKLVGDYSNKNMQFAQLVHVQVENANFQNAILTDVNGSNSTYSAIAFDQTQMSYSTFVHSNFTDNSFTQVNAEGVQWSQSTFERVGFFDSDFQNNYFHASTFTDSRFENSNLSNSQFVNANLTRIEFSNVDLSGANFAGAILEDVVFSDVTYNNTVCPDGSITDVGCGAEAVESPVNCSNLVPEAHLKGCDFKYQNLSDLDLSGAQMQNAKIDGAALLNANLINADLSGASLNYAALMGADFSGANLSGVTATGANFTDANFENAICADGEIYSGQVCLGDSSL